MKPKGPRTACGVVLEIAFVLLGSLGVSSSPLSAQVYLFNKANFATGKSPVAVATGDFNGDGMPDLVVANNGAGNVSVLVNKGDGTFTATPPPGVGSGPVSVAVGDFNGDGKLDLAVANFKDNTVSILLGKGDGTFNAQPTVPVGNSPASLAVGDFNRDGKLDLAVANFNDSTVSILLGKGDGTFNTQSPLPVGSSPASLVVGDLNGDGNLDLAVANSNCPVLPCALGVGSVSILFGDGHGTFAVQPFPPAVGNRPLFLATADFNGDGKLDLAVANFNDNTVSILLNSGAGAFGTKTDFPAGNQPSSVTVGDFNADGKRDLAVTNQKDNTVSILLGTGTGAFAAHVDYATGSSPVSVAAADFMGSGKLGLAVANAADNTVSVLLGNGDVKGTFSPRADWATGAGPLSVAVGDFNGDGKLDLAVANSNDSAVSILLGNGDGTFTLKQTVSTGGAAPVAVAIGDFGNGRPDLAVVNQTSGTVSILLGNGDGTFTLQLPATSVGASSPFSVAVGRFRSNSNFVDLAVANSKCPALPCSLGPGSVSILLGNGDGTFVVQPPITVGNRPLSVVTADFNGDNNLDLAVANFNDNTVSILLGKGDGTFQSQATYATGPGPSSLAVGDFNGDGRLDLAVANSNSPGSVSILLGNGTGTFQAYKNFSTGVDPDSVLAADINGDGRLDLAVANSDCLPPPTPCGLGTVSVLLGNGDGTFQAHSDDATGNFPTSVAAGNFAGHKGEVDLVIANRDSNSVSVYLSTPILAYFPTTLNFGNQVIGTASAVKTVTLSNPGSMPFSITGGSSGITIAGANSGDFAETTTCGASVASGASCAINVTFTPTASGIRNATLTITDSVKGSPHMAALTGTSTVPGASLLPASLDFGNSNVGATSAVKTVSLTNTGNGGLSITGIALGGANVNDFQQNNNCGTSVNAGASCTISVTFTPGDLGGRSGTLTVTDNAGGSTTSQTVNLTGTGTGPIATLSATGLPFGSQVVSTASSPQPVTLTNKGNVTLNNISITVTGANSGDFTQTNTCGSSLSMNASCTITVTFTPTSGNSRTAAVSIADNAGNSPQMVTLYGTGEDFSISAMSSSATITAGQTATYKLSIAPESGFNRPVSFTCTGAPPLATCTVAPASVTPSGSTASTATATVTTMEKSISPLGPTSTFKPFAGRPPRLPWLVWLLAFVTLVGLLAARGRQVRLRRALVGVGLLALSWAACGGGGGGGSAKMGSLGTPPGTYSLTVTGTYTAGQAMVQHYTKLTLKVS